MNPRSVDGLDRIWSEVSMTKEEKTCGRGLAEHASLTSIVAELKTSCSLPTESCQVAGGGLGGRPYRHS